MKRMHFVCAENRLRSPTAAAIFSAYDAVEAIGCGTNADADNPLSGDPIERADVIPAMEKFHKSKVSKKFWDLLKEERLVCLDVPDNYEYMQPELVRILKARIPKYVRL